MTEEYLIYTVQIYSGFPGDTERYKEMVLESEHQISD